MEHAQVEASCNTPVMVTADAVLLVHQLKKVDQSTFINLVLVPKLSKMEPTANKTQTDKTS